MTIHRNWLAAAAAGIGLAACASAPAEQDSATTIYIDPETGAYATDENASEETRMIAALLSMAAKGALAGDLADEEILSIDEVGNVTHIQSGLSCPKTWSQLSLRDTQIYNQNGQDVGCSYDDGKNTILTLYAYRSDYTVTDELQAIMDQVVKGRHPVYEEAGLLNLTGPDTLAAFEADAIRYKAGNGQLMKSGLALADYAGWRVKARVTYPEAIADEFERFLTVVMLNEYDNISARQKQLDSIATDTGDDL